MQARASTRSPYLTAQVRSWVYQGQPTIVHLISLQGIEANVRLPLNAAVKRVAVVSLHSWRYACLPLGVEGSVRVLNVGLPATGTGTGTVAPASSTATNDGHDHQCHHRDDSDCLPKNGFGNTIPLSGTVSGGIIVEMWRSGSLF